VSLIERIDAARQRWNVLEHPFYKRWSCGELSRDELAWYAGEYRHAVVALADTAAKAGNEEHAREEAAHIDLWDEFAAAFHADTTRDPSAETTVCVTAWTAPESRREALAVLYAIEAGQPAVSKTKLDGLAEHYGVATDEPPTPKKPISRPIPRPANEMKGHGAMSQRSSHAGSFQCSWA